MLINLYYTDKCIEGELFGIVQQQFNGSCEKLMFISGKGSMYSTHALLVLEFFQYKYYLLLKKHFFALMIILKKITHFFIS